MRVSATTPDPDGTAGANSDVDFGLSQIYPVWDEDTNDERFATQASFAGSYVAILRDDSTLLILKADKSGDLDEVELDGPLTASKWSSCCLYMDRTGLFTPADSGSEIATQREPILFCLSSDCKLSVSTHGAEACRAPTVADNHA